LTGWLSAAFALGGCDVIEKMSKDTSSEDDGGKKKKKKKKKKKDDDDEDEEEEKDAEEADEDDGGGKKIVKVATYEADDFHWACAHHPGDQSFKLRSYPESEHEDAVEEAQKMLDRLAKLGGVESPLLRGIEAVGGRTAVGMLPDNTKGPYKRGKLVLLIHPKLFDVLRKANEPQAAFLLTHELGHFVGEHEGSPEERKPESELAADAFAGRVLGLEGHSLAQSSAWILSNAPTVSSGAKPDRDKRLEALAAGWRKGCKTSGKCKDPDEPIPGTEKKTPPKKGGSFSDRENR